MALPSPLCWLTTTPGTLSSASAGRRRARSFSSMGVTTPVLAASATPTSSSCADTVARLRNVLRPVTTTDAEAATYRVASSVVAPPAVTVTSRRSTVTKLVSEKRTAYVPGGTASIEYRPSAAVRPVNGAASLSTWTSTDGSGAPVVSSTRP